MKIHHIGIACLNIEIAKKQYLDLGFVVSQELITDSSRNLDYIFMKNEDMQIELVAKHLLSEKSDIDTILAQVKMIGNKMYHICFLTNDMMKDIEKYIGLGYKLIKAPSKAVACNNKNIAFLIHFHFGLIELLEE